MRLVTLLPFLPLILATSSTNPKLDQLQEYTRDDESQPLTTDFGVKLNDTDNSLKAGVRGPTLLEDFGFMEKIRSFDHERIPERAVHARGHAAHGIFESYGDLSSLTKASVFSAAGKKTPVFVRFSTVLGSRGSADTVRDVRGFATKFYTDSGNWDIVGNDIPVFFVQDAIKFLDLIHAGKPEQNTEIPQAGTAHDNFYDFVTLTPETLHTLLWALSPRGIPRNTREIQGFGVHTFSFVNASNKRRFVKFHWRPMNGVTSLVWDEAQKLAGKNSDWHRQDLWEAIEAGNYPEWELGIQVVEEEDEFKFDFDLLDATKLIPEELVPIQYIGKMTLNRNPDNYFAETEQVAFCISHIIPGIDFTNDPLLQGRIFSYQDTQLNRFQSPNWQYIPINRPLTEVHNNQRDGFMRMQIFKGPSAYSPHSRSRPGSATPVREGSFTTYPERVDGPKIRARSPSFGDYISQSQLFYNSLAGWERKQLIEASVFEITKVKTKEIRQRWVDLINQVDHDFAIIVAKNADVEVPPRPTSNNSKTNKSPALSIDHFPLKNIKSKKIGVLAAANVSSTQISGVKSALEAKGAVVDIISSRLGPIPSTDVVATQTFATADSVFYDALFVPGGQSATYLQQSFWEFEDTWAFIRDSYRHGKPIGALGEAVDFVKMAIKPADLTGNKGAGVLTDENSVDPEAFGARIGDAMLKKRFFERFG
ncbi:catalase [Phlyctochytrium arcticum]|nr:catalase [Phlyctochytrium arcticum]